MEPLLLSWFIPARPVRVSWIVPEGATAAAAQALAGGEQIAGLVIPAGTIPEPDDILSFIASLDGALS